jgi:hypothetical protein
MQKFLDLHLRFGTFSKEGPCLAVRTQNFRLYRSRAHLAEMIRLLGPPPPSFLARGNLTQRSFSEEGNSSVYRLSFT